MADLFRVDREIEPGNIPADILAFWRTKGLKPSFSYQDVWKEEHELAFSAAKIMRIDVLEAMRDELERAISQGFPFDQFVKEVTPRMQALGWWAPHDVVDPQTGKTARVNPPRRLRTIFDTNMRTARAVGQWDRIQRNKKFRPYLLYQVGVAERHREQHLAWHGLLLPVDDPFWQTHFPPCGWLCHCGVRAVSRSEADRLEKDGILAPSPEPELDDNGKPTGHVKDQRVPVQRTAPPVQLVPWRNKRTGKVEYVPKGVDPGFNYPPGEGRRRALTVPPAASPVTTPPAGRPVRPSEAPTIPAPPKNRILPEIVPPADSVVADVFTAQANKDNALLKRVSKTLQADLRAQYALPEPLKIKSAVVYGKDHPLYVRATGFTRVKDGRAEIGLSDKARVPAKTLIHELVHTMGGTVVGAYTGLAASLEEACTETLAMHFIGEKGYLSVVRPTSADKPLADRAAGFNQDLSSVSATAGTYKPWRGRLALAIAHVEDTWEPKALQRRVEEVALVWKRSSYRDVKSALDGVITALEPASAEAEQFYRDVLDQHWGKP